MAIMHGTMKVNEKKHLEIGGVDVVNIALENNYPVYVFDEKLIRENMQGYVTAFKEYYPNSQPYYASKAFMCMAMCKLAQQEGFGLDVVSGGELYTAIKAGFPMDNIMMHGNNKSYEELKLAVENKVGRIVIDNFWEIELLDKITKELNMTADVLLRIKPGIHADTHHYVSTGHEDSKFGFIIKENTAKRAIKQVVEKEKINYKGLHMHIGSQIFGTEGYVESIKIMAELIKEMKDEGIDTPEFDLGGGLGVRYIPEHDPMPIKDFIKVLTDAVKIEFAAKGLELPKLMVEPGRSIIGEAGTTVYKIGSITEVPGIRKYIAINGGMGDNIRPALYGSVYEAVVANKMDKETSEVVTVAGKCCETGDITIKDVKLADPQSGDVLAVFVTGAYNYSMASNYNRLAVPGAVFAKDGKYEWIVKPSNYEDILRNDVVPAYLK